MKHIANRHRRSLRHRIATYAAAAVLALAASASTHAFIFGRTEVQRPAATEFGMGPRTSVNQKYTVRLQPREPLRLRQLQTVPVLIVDASGRPVDGASISVDGGMPQHAHGLPTRPRVSRALGDGVYEIEGLRFSMAGWWELELLIESPAGADSVTFNLSL